MPMLASEEKASTGSEWVTKSPVAKPAPGGTVRKPTQLGFGPGLGRGGCLGLGMRRVGKGPPGMCHEAYA
eukprot:scaffold69163_cov71-Phaeocystis_antarctica.AAC.5